MKRFAIALCVFAALSLVAFAQDPNPGPPQFVTFPILTRVAPAGLDHGHFVFTDGAAIPQPLAPNLGFASFNAPLFGGTLLAGAGETDVSDGAQSYEGETGAAGTTVLLGASNHIYPGACSTTAVSNTVGDCAVMAYSGDGAAFSKTTVSRTWNNTTFGISFDPGVDFDKAGNLYFSFGGAPLSGNFPNSVAVAKSSNGGVTWGTPVAVTFNKNRNFDDKYYLAIDRSNGAFANRIYVSWDRNQANNQILLISHSSDGGATWSTPVKVNDGATRFERVIGAYPAVDQGTGVVYDSWHDYAKNIIFVDKSSDGGNTWGTDVAAATTHAGFGQDIGCVGGRSQGPAHAIKVGPSGTIYLVYADPVSSPAGNRGFDVLFTKSTNGGATWSTPVSLNDDNTANDQFHPTLSVEPNRAGGDKVTVTWYDRRDDPANCLAFVYGTQSTDNGVTFTANVKLNANQSDFDGNPNGPGDYSSSTPFSGAVFPFFAEHPAGANAGAFDVFTVQVK